MKSSKKGQVNMLAPAMISLVLAGVLLITGLVMIQETRDTSIVTSNGLCDDGNATNDGDACVAYDDANATLVGMGTFADFWEIIVLAIVITVVIGLLLVVFGGSRSR